MGTFNIADVNLAGISCAVPENSSVNGEYADIFGDEVQKVADSIGVYKRHISDRLCASDLCYVAADRLLDAMRIDRSSIDALLFVSQTPDYSLPATACLLQERLGLSTECGAFDINLGCSGYVYGLFNAASLIAAGAKRVLLLAGDTISKLASPTDRSVALVFGDAGSATLVERREGAEPFAFVLGTDGRGAQNLIVPAGGARNPLTPENATPTERERGNIRSDAQLFMDGAEIFAFTLASVPKLFTRLLEHRGIDKSEVDYVLFHQANRFMLRHLAKRMKLDDNQVPIALEDFGNTSCASIPLTIVTHLKDRLNEGDATLALLGFGVGYSWAGALLSTQNPTIPDLSYVEQAAAGG